MALNKNFIKGGLAILALVASAAAASAAPAYATNNVNVRSGPSTQYRAVDTLRRGEQVDVQQCRGGWCYVEKRGPDGWVSANYLARGNSGGWNDDDYWAPSPPPRPPVWGPRPPMHAFPGPNRPPFPGPNRPPFPRGHDNGGSVCVNGPNGYFCLGN